MIQPERRQFPRIDTPVLVEFPHPSTTRLERSFTQDISEAGMRFPTAVALHVGQELTLTLALSPHDAPMRAVGEVVWIREVSRLGAAQYDVGVRFRWVEDPDRQRLVRHLAALLRPQP